MSEKGLNTDIKNFLNKYFAFEIVESPKTGYLALEGKISILDRIDKLWGQFKILILINEVEYPHTVPIVVEKTKIINRNWDFLIHNTIIIDLGNNVFRTAKGF